MGKMGEAANLGMVAIAAYVVYRLAGLKLPSFEWPTLGLPGITPPSEYRERAEYWKERLEVYELREDSDLDITYTPVVFPEAVPITEFKPPTYFEEKARVHRTMRTEPLSVVDLQTSMAELSAMVPRPSADLDAGGSTDMTPEHMELIGVRSWEL